MNRRTTRSRSNSPSSSVDFSNRRRSSSKSKKPVKNLKSKEDVQVFSSLPPKVEGDIKSYLKLQISKINILQNKEQNEKISNQKISKNVKSNETIKDRIIAKCVWWGEDGSNGAIFRPKIFYNNSSNLTGSSQTLARYVVRSGPKQFSAYLNDMKTLDIELINETTMEQVARVQLFDIGQLNLKTPIKGSFSAFDSSQVKYADVFISIELESLNTIDVRASDQSIASEHSRPVTPTSASNMNEFMTKYQQFEQQQKLKEQKTHPIKTILKPIENKFNSNAYFTENESNDLPKNFKNPIISTLIERGNKLKSEMIKSTSTTAVNLPELDNNFTPNLASSHMGFDFLSEPKNYDYDPEFNEDFLDNDMSRLSDPLHDTNIITSLFYDVKLNSSHDLDNDPELRELLEPSDLFKRLGRTDLQNITDHIPVKLPKDYKQPKSIPQKITSVSSNCSFNSDDYSTDDEYTKKSRVSFEIQSSDDYDSSGSNYKCVDILSPQRISLLNLVQEAKMNIDKLNFFSLTNISQIIDKINRIEQGSSDSQRVNSKTKPPRATKKTDLNQLLFIEYQFPVIANSRDDYEHQTATQVMRATSKRVKNEINSEDLVCFDHQADYSVLFNSQSLETWWRSVIVFKIYCRSNSGTSHLVGLARMNLRNILKSKNFKLYKKLAVLDQLGDPSARKRVGTLHVKVELNSDLKEFNADLVKLKNYELKLKKKPIQKRVSAPSPPPRIPQPIVPQIPLIPKPSYTSTANLSVVVSEEISVPIEMFLSINEGRGFDSSTIKSLNSPIAANRAGIYLICRLFWSKEKIKFETSGSNQFAWTLNLSFLLKQSIINNMKNNFMIIEAWKANAGSPGTNFLTTTVQKDQLIGTIKLPLHEFYLKFQNISSLKDTLKDSSSLATIGVNGWVSAHCPFTGNKTGEINVLLSMGSNEQILNLNKFLFDTTRPARPATNNTSTQPITNKLIEHIFTLTVDNIKIHPVRHDSQENNLDETDFYLKYNFPTSVLDDQGKFESKFNNYQISSSQNVSFKNKIEHRIVLKRTQSLKDELKRIYEDSFNVIFEVWTRSYFPNHRERQIGKGELSIDKLLSVIDNCVLNVNNRSFIIPVLINNESSNDRFIGQLFLTVEYSTDDLNYNIELKPQVSNQAETVCLSIGVLRANRLKMAIENYLEKNRINGSGGFENSSVYIKFSLNFLNRPQDFKQTRPISVITNGYSPEFFDYFEISCPLVSSYCSNKRRTISLAELLEVGQVIFEVWSKFSYTNHPDVLLGTCIVPLEALLENRIGIRGWIPIRPLAGSSILASLVEEDKTIGGLEVVMRFTKSDDYIKVMNSAKEIGWNRSSDLVTNNNNNLSIAYRESVNTKPHLNVNTRKSPRKTVKCLIEIEKAVRLPIIFDERLNKNFEPNVFVTFSTNLDDPSETAQTQLCEKQQSPIWNYQLLASIDMDYFLDDNKNLLLKIWHKYDPKDESERSSNKLIGTVSIDLKPLLCGLSHISGWYNIEDSVNNCQGQLKVNILPQENLFHLKEMNMKKARRFGSPPSESSGSLASFRSKTSSMTSLLTDRTWDNKSESVTSETSELRMGLNKKLSELDELNKLLKERLSKKNRPPLNLVVNPEPIQEAIVEENKVIEEINLVENHIEEVKEVVVRVQPDQNGTVLDSFWASTVDSEGKFSDKSFDGGNLDTLPSSDVVNEPSSRSRKENQIQLQENNQEEQKQIDTEVENPINLNDTELDQTFNLNASYEIVPQDRNDQNGSPEIIETYDIVDNIIDCSKLDDKDEDANENDDLKLDDVDNENPPLDNEEYINEGDDDENLTVIIPEEINKVEDNQEVNFVQEKEISEMEIKEENHDDLAEKLKEIHTKIPNYFIAQDELEMNMKKIHKDYSEINPINFIDDTSSNDSNDKSKKK